MSILENLLSVILRCGNSFKVVWSFLRNSGDVFKNELHKCLTGNRFMESVGISRCHLWKLLFGCNGRLGCAYMTWHVIMLDTCSIWISFYMCIYIVVLYLPMFSHTTLDWHYFPLYLSYVPIVSLYDWFDFFSIVMLIVIYVYIICLCTYALSFIISTM